MAELTDARGRTVRPGDIVAWADTNKRGRIRHGEVTEIRNLGKVHPGGHRFQVKLIEEDGDEGRPTVITNTSNLVVIEAMSGHEQLDELPPDRPCR